MLPHGIFVTVKMGVVHLLLSRSVHQLLQPDGGRERKLGHQEVRHLPQLPAGDIHHPPLQRPNQINKVCQRDNQRQN